MKSGETITTCCQLEFIENNIYSYKKLFVNMFVEF